MILMQFENSVLTVMTRLKHIEIVMPSIFFYESVTAFLRFAKYHNEITMPAVTKLASRNDLITWILRESP